MKLVNLIAACSLVSSLPADDAPSFADQVFPLLQKACFECHGDARQEGDLRLNSAKAIAESGTVEPGDPALSELIRRIKLPAGHDEIMPAVGDPLRPREVTLLESWIKSGAKWPSDFRPIHWSYVAPVRPKQPKAARDWVTNPIDSFVAERLQREGLTPSEPADPATLVRRLHFQLTGLPPRPEVVEAFARNPTEGAYEELVDRLLASPQFGERWARPWLDLARYADSHGFQRDNFREIWAWRDWVIRAMNTDMPFDRFTVEQLAGDLLPDATEQQRVATGFHRCTPTNVEAGSLPEETRVEQVIDRVNTTAAVWLGTTLECAQCHDHKYDPFSQKEYYQLLAYFNSTELEADRASKSPSSIRFIGPKMNISSQRKATERKELDRQVAELNTKISERRARLNESLDAWAAKLAVTAAQQPQVHQLTVKAFRSEGPQDTHRILDDQSILLTGTPAAVDTYVIDLKTDELTNVGAIQLETLTHDKLPGNGPGRGDAKKTNFVLNRFSARLEKNEIKFDSAVADFSQANWDVNGALSDKPKTGWAVAPQFGKPHHARFLLTEPATWKSGQTLQVTLSQQYGGARTIGRVRITAITGNPAASAMPANIRKIVTSTGNLTKKQREQLLTYRQQQDKQTTNLKAELTTVQDQLTKLAPDTTLVMIELDKPRMNYVFDRGDYRNKGPKVSTGTPAVLHAAPESGSDRLALARWLVDRQNPLVARVTVNRWWMEIFGRGLVSTPEDFGVKGERPTHPLLLDWLAVELMDNGWSRKKLLKTIVMSSTFRQSSAVSAKLLERDDKNELLARGPRFRMDAEMIRDNILSAAGLLNLQQFGPSIRPFQPDGVWSKVGGESYAYKVSPGAEQHRRGIYVVIKRGAPYPSFVNFDASARLACTVQRSRTNTPLQALTLLNDPVYVEAAKSMATRVLTERAEATVEEQLTFAFRLATSRAPDDREQAILLNLLETQKSLKRDDALKKNPPAPQGVSAADYRAWVSVTTALINLHETIMHH